MIAAWAVPCVAIALTQTAVIATSIYLHRALAHRSLHLHPIGDVAFRVALWLTTGQCRQQWVAVHRQHHAFTDRPGDPHSPRLLGFWRVQLFNVAYYMREARNTKTLEAFAPDLLHLLAWITGGESLHNNHHAHPRAAKFSLRRSEFDPSWPIIRSLAAVRLLVISGPPVAWARVAASRRTR
jgi:fatty-acid desaturase